MRTIGLISFFLLLSLSFTSAQSDDSLLDMGDNLDALLDMTETEKTEEVQETSKEQIKESPMNFSGDFLFLAGYGAGFYSPAINDAAGFAAMKMSSNFTLDFKIDKNLRVLQKYSLSYPDLDLNLNEFFCDLTLYDTLFARLGRQKITWGISRYYPFTNLTARLPQNFTGSSNNYALKLNIPVMIGGVELLAFTREGFISDSTAPELHEIGMGGTINLAHPLFDLTLGSYYMKAINWRQFYSLSTTLFHKIELYHEFSHSYDIQEDDEILDLNGNYLKNDTDRSDFSANLGMYTDFFEGRLQLSAEYFYCGEESELEISGIETPLIWGSNLGAGFKLDLLDNRVHLFSQVKYNINENSGVLIPGITFDWIPHLALNLSASVLLNGGGTYSRSYDYPVSVGLLAIISGKF